MTMKLPKIHTDNILPFFVNYLQTIRAVYSKLFAKGERETTLFLHILMNLQITMPLAAENQKKEKKTASR